MHGNTECVNNYKTRRYENIRAEVEAFFDVHDDCGAHQPNPMSPVHGLGAGNAVVDPRCPVAGTAQG